MLSTIIDDDDEMKNFFLFKQTTRCYLALFFFKYEKNVLN